MLKCQQASYTAEIEAMLFSLSEEHVVDNLMKMMMMTIIIIIIINYNNSNNNFFLE